jgi:hypothetical protein
MDNSIKKNTLIADIQYFGNLNYYFTLSKSTYIAFLYKSIHQKGMKLNRTCIYGPNKIMWLSVPLEGGREIKASIKDLKIANQEPWQRIHWRSIHDSYKKAPWFEEYAPALSEIYDQNYNFLWDWNMRTIQWALEVLGLKQVILSPDEHHPVSEDKFFVEENAAIKPLSYPEYNQVFSDRFGFVPNLSILDLIMNEGPRAAEYLKSIEVIY